MQIGGINVCQLFIGLFVGVSGDDWLVIKKR